MARHRKLRIESRTGDPASSAVATWYLVIQPSRVATYIAMRVGTYSLVFCFRGNGLLDSSARSAGCGGRTVGQRGCAWYRQHR